MPKFMFRATYTAEGARALQQDKASGREQSISAACEAMGGKLDALYFALGEDDVLAIVDLPSHLHAASLGAAVGASGKARSRAVCLLTVEEMDKALGQEVKYRPPGG